MYEFVMRKTEDIGRQSELIVIINTNVVAKHSILKFYTGNHGLLI